MAAVQNGDARGGCILRFMSDDNNISMLWSEANIAFNDKKIKIVVSVSLALK